MSLNYEDYDAETFESSKRKKSIRSSKQQKKNWLQGQIIYISPEFFVVHAKEQNYECSLKGTLKKQLKQKKDRLCCGDVVFFDPQKLTIEEQVERTTVLMRENPSHKHQLQVLAANMQVLLITSSVKEPELSPYLLDLYVISAQRSNLQPVILLNKVDLLTEDDQEIKDRVSELKQQYQALGIEVLCMSAKSQQGFDELKAIMKDQASVFSGESGVGKSSLINVIAKTSLRVNEVSEKSQKGMHTTTLSQLLKLNFGGWCLDTPGIQSLSFNSLSPIEIRNSFPELMHVGCQFSDCLHMGEKGCKIQEAIDNKTVHKLRLESYYRLQKEVKQNQ